MAAQADASTPTPCWLHLDPHHHHPYADGGNGSHPLLSLPSPSSPPPLAALNFTVSREEEELRGRIIIGLAIVRLCLASLGCVANMVAAVVLTNRKIWSPTSMLLLSLVIYDAFYLLLVIPVGATSVSINLQFTPDKKWRWVGHPCAEDRPALHATP